MINQVIGSKWVLHGGTPFSDKAKCRINLRKLMEMPFLNGKISGKMTNRKPLNVQLPNFKKSHEEPTWDLIMVMDSLAKA